MTRKNSFIDLCEILSIKDKDYLSSSNDYYELIDLLKNNKKVKIVKNIPGRSLVFSFSYEGEIYFFTFDARAEIFSALFAEEVANDMGISNVSYDLARIGNIKGHISKNFITPKAKYITGEEILKIAYKEVIYQELRENGYIPFDEESDIQVYTKYNNLEDIWAALEKIYRDRPNMQEIVRHLMSQIVDMFIFDILTGQPDRHTKNWMIVEYQDGNVELQPLFDNARAFFNYLDFTLMCLPITSRQNGFTPIKNIYDNLQMFLTISTDEFKKRLLKNFWILTDENILNIITRIENKIGCPLSEDIKRKYKAKWKNYLNFFMDSLNIEEIPQKGKIAQMKPLR